MASVTFDLPLYGDGLIKLLGPVDLDAIPIAGLGTITSDGVLATARLFDVALDTRTVDLSTELTADQVATDTSMAVEDEFAFADADSVHVQLDSGEIHPTTVSGAPTANTIVLAAGLPSAASAGNKIIRVAHETNAVHLAVESVDGWKVGYALRAVLDSGTVKELTVTQVHETPCPVLKVDAALAGTMSSGYEVKRQLGADLVMVDFGTEPSPPVEGSELWGYSKTIPHDHAGFVKDLFVRGEITVVDGAINLFKKALATVKKA